MRHLIGTLSVALVSLSASASDDLFGAYEGGDLDEYACYDQGRIEFDVPIDRVISRDKTGWSDLFLSRPVLRMAVYDVDDDDLSFGCAERDEVYVNDVFVGTLSGANDTWSEFNIELPPEMWDPIHGAVRDATFVAPGVSPTPGVNHVRIEIDTSGCRHWCVEVNYAEISVEAVRPVTFIHGILSSAATWDDVLPLVPGSDGLAYDVGPRASTGHNGPLVSRAIEQTLTGFGVDRTNLVCHSKGGLDAEWASLTSGAQIESLVTLGSPLQGSEMADHFLYDHGSLMLISALMGSYHTAMSLATFTRERLYETFGSTEIPGIHYHHLAGVADAPDLVGCPLNAVHLPSVFPFRVAHDGYVGCDRASPAWGSLDTTAGVEHVDMTSSAALWGWAWDRILGGDAGSVACAGPTRSLAATTVQLPGTRGSLAPGGEREAVLSIDGSVDAFSISALTADPGVALTLTDPAGAAWSAGRPGGGLSWTSVEVVPGALYAVGASAQAPAAGAWTATVASPAGGAFELGGELVTTLSIEAASDAGAYVEGDPVELTASIDDAGLAIDGASVVARLTDADLGTEVAVPLAGAGGGRYAATWPAQPGAWLVEVVARGADAQGVSWDRAARTALTVARPTGRVLGVTAEHPIDLDGDGLYDQLGVQVQVQVLAPSDFQLVGTLQGGAALVSAAGVSSPLESGTRTLDLQFPASQLHASHADGPYVLQELALVDGELGLEVDHVSGSYQTAAYRWYEFDGPPVVLRGARDEATDVDGDGDLDELEIAVEVEVIPGQGGRYAYNAMLVDREGTLVDWYDEERVDLAAGVHELSFVFDTSVLVAGGHQAPYALRSFYLFDEADPGVRLSVPTAHTTGLYCLCTFDGSPPGCVEPDADADGFAVCEGDCDDARDDVGPTTLERCDAVDNDCDGASDEDFDVDRDGFTTCAGDCSDADYFVNPTAIERCNLADDDCDGDVDEGFDADGDGAASCAADCDDHDPDRSPAFEERCGDAVDEDCDGELDDGCPAPAVEVEETKGGCACSGTGAAPGTLVWAVWLAVRRRRLAARASAASA